MIFPHCFRPAHELRCYFVELKVALPHPSYPTFTDEDGFIYELRRVLRVKMDPNRLSESFEQCFGHDEGGGDGMEQSEASDSTSRLAYELV